MSSSGNMLSSSSMEGIVPMLIGLFTAAVAVLTWIILRKVSRRKYSQPKEDKMTIGAPEATINLERSETKRELACASMENLPGTEKEEISQAQAGDFAHPNYLETSTPEKDVEETELNVKEKFYLFLEKGFCPELEKGAEDPLYKYLRSCGGQPAEAFSELDDPTGGFCPMGMMGSEGGSDSEADEFDSESSPTDPMKDEIDTLERMIHRGAAKGEIKTGTSDFISSQTAKCPFASRENLGAPVTSCPFKRAMENQDEDSLADIPSSHRVSSTNAVEKLEEIEKVVKSDVRENGDGASADKVPIPKEKYLLPTRSQEFRDIINSVESSLSAKEIEEEEKIRTQQIAVIMNLLQEEQLKLGQPQIGDVEALLKLYI